jgi:type I restriction enzyme S subunit
LENLDVRPFISGTTRSKLTKAGAARIEIPIPDIEEQRRIAKILDHADDLRAKRRKALANVDELSAAIFDEMFGDPMTHESRWPVAQVDYLCSLVVDCVNRTAPLSEVPTDYKMIRTTNVKSGRVDLTNVRYVDRDTFERWNRRATPRAGDVLLTREAPVGQAGVLREEASVFLGQRLMLYRPDPSRATSEYLLASFSSRFLQAQFDRHGSGSTVKHLSLPVCRSLSMLAPPLGLQQEFTKRIAQVESVRESAIEQAQGLAREFASLQQKAFAGLL